MATRIETVLIDDLDGTEATETIAFALSGVDYEIDLNEGNAFEFWAAIGLYANNARGRLNSTVVEAYEKAQSN